jgi:hypothetical protein
MYAFICTRAVSTTFGCLVYFSYRECTLFLLSFYSIALHVLPSVCPERLFFQPSDAMCLDRKMIVCPRGLLANATSGSRTVRLWPSCGPPTTSPHSYPLVLIQRFPIVDHRAAALLVHQRARLQFAPPARRRAAPLLLSHTSELLLPRRPPCYSSACAPHPPYCSSAGRLHPTPSPSHHAADARHVHRSQASSNRSFPRPTTTAVAKRLVEAPRRAAATRRRQPPCRREMAAFSCSTAKTCQIRPHQPPTKETPAPSVACLGREPARQDRAPVEEIFIPAGGAVRRFTRSVLATK